MRFQKRIPKKIWSENETKNQISKIRNDIAVFNQEMNSIDKQIEILKYNKKIIKRKVQRKWQYLTHLQHQLGDSVHQRIMREFIEQNRNK